MPRSIDKVRASLPGGDLGDYKTGGTTEVMLATLGLSLESFTAAVTTAQSDADVATFISRHVPAAKYEVWNALLAERLPRGGNRREALEVYPWLKDRPDLVFLVDILEEDDRRQFNREREIG
ncbi:MAG: hypothetical protein NVSMB64_17900 [Candidatus Velthaea sp.]